MKRCKEYGGRRETTCLLYVNCKRVREKGERGVRGEKIEERREKEEGERAGRDGRRKRRGNWRRGERSLKGWEPGRVGERREASERRKEMK